MNGDQRAKPEAKQTRWSDLALSIFWIGMALLGWLVCILACQLGILLNALFVFLVALAIAVPLLRFIGICKRTLNTDFIKAPLRRHSSHYLLQFLNQTTCIILAATAVQIALIPRQFKPQEYVTIEAFLWGSAAILLFSAMVPYRRIRISTNLFFAFGSIYIGTQLFRVFVPTSEHNAVVLASPLKGEWYVVQGGNSTLINHHYSIPQQRDALDITKTEADGMITEKSAALESYQAFAQPIYAPADGKVITVVNDRPDMPIGKTDDDQIAGNHIVLDIGRGHFVMMAHLKKGSIRVEKNQTVKCGEPIAQCGNSGNTSRPHLHIQAQNGPDFQSDHLQTLPILFRNVTRIRRGSQKSLDLADFQRNDILIDAPITTPLQSP